MHFFRAPVLTPTTAGFSFLSDAAVIVSEEGRLESLTAFADRPGSEAANYAPAGLLLPPLVDCHIHIPQFPIRGRFMEGVRPPGGLLEGLARNVYPAEARCVDPTVARQVAREFLEDTRSNGTLGGVAYMTSHPAAVRAALEELPETWRVGLVLMDQNCPGELMISVDDAVVAFRALFADFGQRVVVTDRFAVVCSSRLRRAASAVAAELGMTTQTHLSEQPAELAAVARLYPDARHYTGVYDRDGLLGPGTLLAHCLHLSDEEWGLLGERGCAVCHCPVSNTALGSGTLDLSRLAEFGVPWALCTDVGASPSTSLLEELSHFLEVHAGRPWGGLATPEVGLLHATVAARELAGVAVGGLTPGAAFGALEFAAAVPAGATEGEVIRALFGAKPVRVLGGG